MPVPNLTDSRWRKSISTFLRRNPEYKVVLLDNLASLAPGIDENGKVEWDPINQWLLSLRSQGIAVIMVHHAGKNGEQRGISSREDNIDVSIELTHPVNYKQADGAVFDVAFKKARGVYGDGAEKFRLSLQHMEQGISWTTDATSSDKKEAIIAMLGQGVMQKRIAELVSCGASYVSQIKAGAIDDGFLTEQGDFTDKGKSRYGKIDVQKYMKSL